MLSPLVDRRDYYISYRKRLARQLSACPSVDDLSGSAVASTAAEHWLNARQAISTANQTELEDQLAHQIASTFQFPKHHEVLLRMGASDSLHGLFRALHAEAPCGEVLLPIPSYGVLAEIPHWYGLKVVPIDWRDLCNSFRQHITHNTIAIAIASPNNPTGECLPFSVWQSLLNELPQHVLILSIETYRGLVDMEAHDKFHTDARVVRIGSLSKAYGLSTLRCGWIAKHKTTLPDLSTQYDLLENCGSSLLMSLSLAAFPHLNSFLEAAKNLVAVNRPIVQEALDKLARDGIIEPTRATDIGLAFPRLRHITNSRELVTQLFADYGVAVAPGCYFGDPRGVRIGFGQSTDTVSEGMSRWVRGLCALVRCN